MIVELLFFYQTAKTDPPTLDDLALLTQDYCINSRHETIEFTIRILSNSETILRLIERNSQEKRNTTFIIISDQLTKLDAKTYKATELLNNIKILLKNTKSFCGLIGIFLNEIPKPTLIDEMGIDEYATFQHCSIQLLRDKILKVVQRIWLKIPVFYNNPLHLRTVNSIEISSVFTKEEFYDCLRLRKRVYKNLGYIAEQTEEEFETDSYDRVSYHFRAIDSESSNKTVGTLRLIVPGAGVSFRTYPNLLLPDGEWFMGISDTANPPSLPVFHSFNYFRPSSADTIPETDIIRPRDVCEISRVIVAPEHRGIGISSLLMDNAIKVAQQLKRKYIWIECAPHHIKMYKKFGFTIKNHDNGCYFERIQQFDTWAVAMYLKLEPMDNPSSLSKNTSSICYYLPISKGRAENCTLRFQYFDKSVDKIKKIFEQPLSNFERNTPLKELIPSTLTNLNIEQFVSCLKQVFDAIEPNKLSFIQKNGRNHVFNAVDIKSGNRSNIELHLNQWLG